MSTRRQFGRIRRLPSGRWQARYPDHSNTDVPAPVTFPSKADAARFLARVQTEQERGEWRDPRLGEVTFATWVEDWLESNPAKRATTRARDESVLNTHFVAAFGTIPLARVTPADVRRAVDAMDSNLARRRLAARTFIPAVAAAELDPALTVHGLRHVATSLMVEGGEHPRVIQQRLGHAGARLSMELYAHVPEAADRQVAAHLHERFVPLGVGPDESLFEFGE